ncbi:hypothetical protein [Roseateles sp.]|uniref:hypothetical protein n=1 Tax=Roseateles sp. TaxID=1971397 RepID=UPI0031DDE154
MSRDSNDPSVSKPLRWLVNWSLGICALAVLGRGVFLTLTLPDPTSGIALLGAGLVLALASTIERFSKFKGLGIEAELKAVEQKLDRAEEILGQIQRLSVLVNRNAIRQAAEGGRWNAGLTHDELHRLVGEVRAQLKDVGTPPSEVAIALAPWADVVLWDWAVKIMEPWLAATRQKAHELWTEASALNHQGAPHELANAKRQESDETRQKPLAEFEALHTVSRDQLESGLLTVLDRFPNYPGEAETVRAELRAWAQELAHLRTHHDLLTPSKWFKFLAPQQ